MIPMYYVPGSPEPEQMPDEYTYVRYDDHLKALVECERLAKKCWLDQSESYWKIEYDRLMERYGHLFMGII